MITGIATDNLGVTSVGVAIYRNVNGGQYWNGTTFQAANTTVPATLASPGAATTTFTYNFPTWRRLCRGRSRVDAATRRYCRLPQLLPNRQHQPHRHLHDPTDNQVFNTRPVSSVDSHRRRRHR